jgi:anti-sigma factor RsiW
MNDLNEHKQALTAYALGDLPAEQYEAITEHLLQCPDCQEQLDHMRSLLNTANGISQLGLTEQDREKARQSILITTQFETRRRGVKTEGSGIEKHPANEGPAVGSRRWAWIAGLAAGLLIIVSGLACFVLSRDVADLKHELKLARRDIALAQQEIAMAPTDNSATINLYLKEHRDVVARHASLSSAQPEPLQMRVNRGDILYYELLDDNPEYMQPGIIVRGPSSPRQISLSEAPVISNGHSLTLFEARKTANFELQAPPWLDPGYRLDQTIRIEGRDALQLLYTDGINSVSLFEQSLDGQRGLSRQDLREYAVYRNPGKAAGTILAWKDEALSYVLIGNAEMSQLMNMAQSISGEK